MVVHWESFKIFLNVSWKMYIRRYFRSLLCVGFFPDKYRSLQWTFSLCHQSFYSLSLVRAYICLCVYIHTHIVVLSVFLDFLLRSFLDSYIYLFSSSKSFECVHLLERSMSTKYDLRWISLFHLNFTNW